MVMNLRIMVDLVDQKNSNERLVEKMMTIIVRMMRDDHDRSIQIVEDTNRKN